MNPDTYLAKLIKRYEQKKVERGDERFKNIEKIIKKWSGKHLNKIELTGANAKNTAISLSTDCDVLISLKNYQTEDLPKLYKSLEYDLLQNGLQPKRHTNSIAVNVEGLQLELMPAVFQKGSYDYHELYYNPLQKVVKTNPHLHVNHILESGRTDEIKLLKIWRSNHEIHFPTLLLELSVIRALNKIHVESTISERFEAILRFLSEKFLDTLFVDPANSDIHVSAFLTSEEKSQIAEKAKQSLVEKEIHQVVW